MGCCKSKEELIYERRRLLGNNYQKLFDSAAENRIDVNGIRHIFRDAMDTKYEYTSVIINDYNVITITLDNSTYEIVMTWKIIKNKCVITSLSHNNGYILTGDRLRKLVAKKITLDALLDSYFEYIDGHVRSMKDIVLHHMVKQH